MSTAELWSAYLPNARWFQAKGLTWTDFRVRPLPWYAQAEVKVRSELAHVSLPGGEQVYHLLVGYLPAGTGEPEAVIGQTLLEDELVDVVDAPKSAQAMHAFLRGIAAPGVVGVEWLEPPPDPGSPVKVFSGEQSNTNVSVGESVLLKIFRKLPPGRNLEAEMLRALANSGVTPKLIGTLATPDNEFDLAVLCQRISNATDGWSYATSACRAGTTVSAEMRELGQDLRDLHAFLADISGTHTIDSAQINEVMLQRLDAACGQLEELATLRDGLRATLQLPAQPVTVQRVHGDFHLGQVLRSPDGWTFIDFEGEPLKSLEERKAPDAVWRDVAGLTRSLDYARFSHADPTSPDANTWYHEARAAFLEGYLGDPALAPAILHAYETDKAIYELIYETRNRPDWAAIPRRAVREAAGLVAD
jgi:maltokinase